MSDLFDNGWTKEKGKSFTKDDLKGGWLDKNSIVPIAASCGTIVGGLALWQFKDALGEAIQKVISASIVAGEVSLVGAAASGAIYGATKARQVLASGKETITIKIKPSENQNINMGTVQKMVEGLAQPGYSGLEKLVKGRIWYRWQIVKDEKGKISFYLICPKSIGRTVKDLIKLGFPKCLVEVDESYHGIPHFYNPSTGDVGHMAYVTPSKAVLGLKNKLENNMGDILFMMPDESVLEIRFSQVEPKELKKASREEIEDLNEMEKKTKEERKKIEAITNRYVGRTTFDVSVILYSNRAIKRMANSITSNTKGLNRLTLKQYKVLKEHRTPFKYSVHTPLPNRKMTWNDIELANLMVLPPVEHPVMEFIDVAFEKLKPKPNELNRGHKIAIADSEELIVKTPDGKVDFDKSRPIRVTTEVFTVHPIISGKSGSGKGAAIISILDEFLEKWVTNPNTWPGLTLHDPHGLTIYLIINRLQEIERTKNKQVDWDRVKCFHVGNEENPMPLNLLYKDADTNIDDMVEETAQIILQAFESANLTASKIVLEHGLAALLSDKEPHLIEEFSKIFQKTKVVSGKKVTWEPSELLEQCLDHIDNPFIVDWFETEVIEPDNPKNISTVVTRLAPFLNRKNMRDMYSSQENTFADTKTILDDGHIVLISYQGLPEGHPAFKLTAGWIANRYHNEMKKRNPDEKNRVHLMAFDEAQMFHVSRFIDIVQQDRKFGFGLMIATQDIDKLNPDLRKALTVNSGMMISLNQSEGAKIMAGLMRDKFTANHLSNLEKMHAAMWSDEGSANILFPPPAFRYEGEQVRWLDDNGNVTKDHKEVAKLAREKFEELVSRDAQFEDLSGEKIERINVHLKVVK